MATSTYDCSFIDDIMTETDDTKRENIIHQLKTHLIELENNNKFVDELSHKFASLQDEFKRLSISKKQIEIELNNKISLLQLENERLTSKYISAKEQINLLMNNSNTKIDNNNFQHMNILIDNNNKLVPNNDYDNTILFYQKQLDEANTTIMRLNNMIKNLEDKNQSIMHKCLNQMEYSNNKEVIIGLKRVIDEKEKTIINLYGKYDKLTIKYEDVVKQNGILQEEIMFLRNGKVSSYQQYCNNINGAF